MESPDFEYRRVNFRKFNAERVDCERYPTTCIVSKTYFQSDVIVKTIISQRSLRTRSMFLSNTVVLKTYHVI